MYPTPLQKKRLLDLCRCLDLVAQWGWLSCSGSGSMRGRDERFWAADGLTALQPVQPRDFMSYDTEDFSAQRVLGWHRYLYSQLAEASYIVTLIPPQAMARYRCEKPVWLQDAWVPRWQQSSGQREVPVLSSMTPQLVQKSSCGLAYIKNHGVAVWAPTVPQLFAELCQLEHFAG